MMFKKIACLFLFLPLLFSCNRQSEPPDETLSPTSDHAVRTDYTEIVPKGEHDVRLLFANVGKADAALLEVDGHRFMIDTGTEESVPALLSAMAYMEWDSLDGLFLTHCHNDHMGGAEMLFESFPIAVCYLPAISGEMTKLSAPAAKYDVPAVYCEAGSVVALSDGVYAEVLAPYRYHPGDENNHSMVMRIRVNDTVILLTSDMLFDEERTLFQAEYDLSCTVLKVAHHGKKDATGTKFAKAASPDIAVISTDSAIEPPHESVVDLLTDTGAEIYVTEDYDVGCLVEISRDGSYVVLEAQRCPPQSDSLTISAVSAETQTITLKNLSPDALDISGYFLLCENGSDVFRFPKGTVIETEEEVVTAALGAADTPYVWHDARILTRNKTDAALLYDRYGNLLCRVPAE